MMNVNERPLLASSNDLTTPTGTIANDQFPFTIIITRTKRKKAMARKEYKKEQKKHTEKVRMTQATKKPIQKGEFVKYSTF